MKDVDEKADEKNRSSNTTDLSQHKREGSILKPPMRQIGNIQPSSWKDDRMPEILWAVLLIGNMSREDALEIFRSVGEFVGENPDLYDITLSGIASWKKELRINLLRKLADTHPNSKRILRSLMIFPALPAYEDWKEIFGEVSGNLESEITDYLAKGVLATIGHQSQEATDCRWVKVLCMIRSGKLKMPTEMLSQIINYPNEGEMTTVRPSIRATEISFATEGGKSNWPEDFWKACLQATLCSPLPRKEQRKDAIYVSNQQIHRIRHLLLLHYFITDTTTNVDARHDTIFGFGFYVLRLLDELIKTNLSRGAIGRMVLRSCVECYITLSYLIKKGDNSPWNDFRDYGIGQMKLSYLKTRTLNDKPSFVDEDFLKEIANEDRWEEFSDIKIKPWADINLRDMSIEAGCKEIYDSYYDWTSNFSHGSWGAIRESSFSVCANPLHRLHLIPSVEVFALPGVLEDVVKICNLVLDLIESQHPNTHCKITHEPKPEKFSFWKYLISRLRYRKNYRFLKFITGK